MFKERLMNTFYSTIHCTLSSCLGAKSIRSQINSCHQWLNFSNTFYCTNKNNVLYGGCLTETFNRKKHKTYGKFHMLVPPPLPQNILKITKTFLSYRNAQNGFINIF